MKHLDEIKSVINEKITRRALKASIEFDVSRWLTTLSIWFLVVKIVFLG